MTATIRKRRKDEAPISDSCNTPLWLNDMLGQFSTDPCSNDRSTVHADWSFSLEKKLDGLKLPWRDRAFSNWPYSDPDPWADKAIYELQLGRCTELVVLAKLDTSTDWWSTITQPIKFVDINFELEPEIWPFNKRLQFDEPPELVEMRIKKRREAIARVERVACPRDGCFGRTGGGPCATRNGSPHLERIHAAGLKSIPSETTSNNFCSVIIHHRGKAPKLNLESVATRWVRPISDTALAALDSQRTDRDYVKMVEDYERELRN